MHRPFTFFIAVMCISVVSATTQPALAQTAAGPAGPSQLSALAPANLSKSRPKAPFDVTGTW
ncbi:MAG TPA: hypothetical protein VFS23_03845, partial [Vicinamibacterales bacterium]|nr:hypothetical protein [Vicinamibacterales bacterium]